MLKHHMMKFAGRLAAAVFLLFPMVSLAADVQVFPPLLPGTTTICPPVPAGSGYTYTLVWDGQHNVMCSQVPTNCTAGQGLQFNPATGNFACITPCSGPTTTSVPTTTACTATGGVQGVVINTVVTACDGTSTTTSQCQPPQINFATTDVTSCTIGSTVSGQMVNGVLDQTVCNSPSPSCGTYVCTASGLQPQ